MELKRKWTKESYEYNKKLKDNYGVDKVNSSKQVGNAMLRLEIVEDLSEGTGKSGLEGLIAECVEKGNDRGADFLQTVLDARGVHKAVNTFLRGVAEATSELDGRIHPDLKIFTTVTGRLTCSDPSLLNYPHSTKFAAELRKVFIPDPGYVFVHRDQSQFELRVYSVLTGDPMMIERLRKTPENPKPDPHRDAAIVVYGESEYYRLNELTFGFTRTSTKSIVFGRLYLRGVASVAAQLGMKYGKTEKICLAIDEMFPGIVGYRNDCLRQLDEFQELVNPYGRRRRFPIITSDNYHDCKAQSCNFPVQSTANDSNLMGMLAVDEEFMHCQNPEVWQFFPVHDAIEYQVLESKAQELDDRVAKLMAGVPMRYLNVVEPEFDTDGGMGDSWGAASIEWEAG